MLQDATTDDDLRDDVLDATGRVRVPPTKAWEPDRPADAVPLPELATRLCAGAVAISAATAAW